MVSKSSLVVPNPSLVVSSPVIPEVILLSTVLWVETTAMLCVWAAHFPWGGSICHSSQEAASHPVNVMEAVHDFSVPHAMATEAAHEPGLSRSGIPSMYLFCHGLLIASDLLLCNGLLISYGLQHCWGGHPLCQLHPSGIYICWLHHGYITLHGGWLCTTVQTHHCSTIQSTCFCRVSGAAIFERRICNVGFGFCFM